MLVVDTNVLIHAADAGSPHHDRCRRWIEGQRSRPDAWFSTWPIFYEFLRVMTHPRVLRGPLAIDEARGFLRGLEDSPGFSMLLPTERHGVMLDAVIGEMPAAAGNILHELHTVVLMREHGIRRVVTRDADFHRFPGIEVFDPCAR